MMRTEKGEGRVGKEGIIECWEGKPDVMGNPRFGKGIENQGIWGLGFEVLGHLGIRVGGFGQLQC